MDYDDGRWLEDYRENTCNGGNAMINGKKIRAMTILYLIGMLVATSFMPLLEIIADYGFWCMLERPSKPSGSQIYHLRHDLGSKWTRFLRGYVESARKVLGLSMTIDCTEFTVTITVKNKAIESN